MKRVISYIITVIFSIFLGCTLMYGIIYFFPNTIIKTIMQEKKIVNVVDEGISEGIKNVYNSVVVVETYKNNNLSSSGSGFAFKTDSDYIYVMTNHHVISKGETIIITLADTTELTATLVGSDAYADIAVLKVGKNDKLQEVKTESIENVKVGDTVFAVGSPMGKSFSNTVTRGILSGKNRLVQTTINNTNEEWIMNVVQTDAAINPGNSGGPLCDVSGNVIGINSLKIVESSIEGLGFAIPIEDALDYANSIIENGKIVRGYIGISMLDVNSKIQLLRNNIEIDDSIKKGVVIVEVFEDSPAEKSKLQKGDVILKINDNSINNISEFRYHLYKYKIGEEINLTIYRNEKTEIIKSIIEASN